MWSDTLRYVLPNIKCYSYILLFFLDIFNERIIDLLSTIRKSNYFYKFVIYLIISLQLKRCQCYLNIVRFIFLCLFCFTDRLEWWRCKWHWCRFFWRAKRWWRWRSKIWWKRKFHLITLLKYCYILYLKTQCSFYILLQQTHLLIPKQLYSLI